MLIVLCINRAFLAFGKCNGKESHPFFQNDILSNNQSAQRKYKYRKNGRTYQNGGTSYIILSYSLCFRNYYASFWKVIKQINVSDCISITNRNFCLKFKNGFVYRFKTDLTVIIYFTTKCDNKYSYQQERESDNLCLKYYLLRL